MGTPRSEPVSLQLAYRDDCLIIRTHGRDILERMAETVRAIAAAIRARPVRATLIDLRDVPGPITFLDRYQLGEMAGRYLPRILIACLVLAEQAVFCRSCAPGDPISPCAAELPRSAPFADWSRANATHPPA